ncbi:MAG: hypothetical protein ABEI96_03300 [Haloarculaceae archaeon]
MDDRVLLQVTVTLLVAGLLLVGIGAAGIGASLPLAAAGVVVTGATYVLVDRSSPDRLGLLDRYADRRLLWAIPALATVVVLGWLGATPGELQTLGGVVGLLGMANYFLRPIYHLLSDVLAWASGSR